MYLNIWKNLTNSSQMQKQYHKSSSMTSTSEDTTDLFKHLKIATSLSEDIQLPDEDEYYYVIKVPFPDEDIWVYILTEGGFNDGKLLKFTTRDEAQKWANSCEIKNCLIEKIKA